jgi:L-asparaginase
MAYTAAALTLALPGLGKPVILTGSQIPGCELFTDARSNLINAMRLAVMDLSGVYVVFDTRIIPGNRATKSSESKIDAFRTVNDYDAGEICISIKLKDSIPARNNKTIKRRKGFNADIFVLTLTPGYDVRDLDFLLKNNRIRGIVIEAFGTGNLPDSFSSFFINAQKKKIPVVITSQCLNGMTMMKSYAVGKKALDAGVIEGFDQSMEMLAVKLMWALHHYKYQEIKKIMQTNFSGELNLTYQNTDAIGK